MNQIKKSWYAVYTKPRWEKKVANQLERNQIEHYCPLRKVSRQWRDRRKIILEPLFTSYIFVRLADTEHIPVRKTEGVMNFVHWLKKPAVIRDEEIDIIRHFL